MTNTDPAVHFFLQLAFILVVCRIVGYAVSKIGQPRVVGEMIAGIMLGPSLFGWLMPGAHSWLFPKESMGILLTVNQVGLVLYMFVVGIEFRARLTGMRVRSAAAVSFAGILTPLSIGALLATALYSNKALFPGDIGLPGAMLFLGASISVTAFPMLARIIQERGIAGTAIGTLALAAGSINDAVAWLLLAALLATLRGAPGLVLVALGGGAVYAAGVFLLRSTLFRHLGVQAERAGKVSGAQLTAALVFVMLGAWFTHAVGLDAVLGAFVMGVAIPRGLLARDLRRMIEPIAVNGLLPLFFVFSGLNTKLGLVDTPFLWLVTAAIILAACLGKGVACWLAARASGEDRRSSLGIGALMNARGLMELILLNIALSYGVITPTLFTMMVLMAVITTLIASPLFDLAYGRHHRQPPLSSIEVVDVMYISAAERQERVA